MAMVQAGGLRETAVMVWRVRHSRSRHDTRRAAKRSGGWIKHSSASEAGDIRDKHAHEII